MVYPSSKAKYKRTNEMIAFLIIGMALTAFAHFATKDGGADNAIIGSLAVVLGILCLLMWIASKALF